SSNEDGNTACVTTASTAFPTGSVNVATISQNTTSAYIASQSNGESHALVADEEAPTEFALMANTESKTGLPEFVDDTVTDYSRPSPTIASTSKEGQNKDSSTSENVASPNPPKPFVKFVKSKDSQPESKSKEQETPKKSQVNMLNNTDIQIRNLR
nr:hypothetical protein [Tanacetum cinerariifolium]